MGNDGLMLMIASLWFLVISKNWVTLMTAATLLQLLNTIWVYYTPESPKFLVSKGRYDEARAVMTKIARYNKIEKLDLTSEEEKAF